MLWTESAALMIPAAPAADFRCPIWDFTDVRPIDLFGRPLKTSPMELSSAKSPTAVDVPCASMNDMVDLSTLASFKAVSIART